MNHQPDELSYICIQCQQEQIVSRDEIIIQSVSVTVYKDGGSGGEKELDVTCRNCNTVNVITVPQGWLNNG